MTHEDRFVLYCVYYAQYSNSNVANLIKGVLKLDTFNNVIKRLEDKKYIYDYKINPKMLSKVQSLTRFGDDPDKMRVDLLLITLEKCINRITKDNIALDSNLLNKIRILCQN